MARNPISSEPREPPDVERTRAQTSTGLPFVEPDRLKLSSFVLLVMISPGPGLGMVSVAAPPLEVQPLITLGFWNGK